MTNKKLIHLSKEALKKMEIGSLQYNFLLMSIHPVKKLETLQMYEYSKEYADAVTIPNKKK